MSETTRPSAAFAPLVAVFTADEHGAGAGAASRALSAVVFYALVALIPATSIPYSAVEPWWVAIFETAVFLLAALWAAEGALTGRWLDGGHLTLLLPAAGLVALAFVQSLPLGAGDAISHDPYETRLAAVRMLALAAYAAMLLRYTGTERRLRVLVYACVATALLSALFGISRQASQRGEGFLLAYLQPGVGYTQFINKNHFAYLAEMALGLVFCRRGPA